MNSEKILQRFGSYRVKVLHQDEVSRVANLCSQHDGQDICRTLAVTRFAAPTPEALASADQAIRGGMSIGSTLAEASWTSACNRRTEGDPPPSGSLTASFLSITPILASALAQRHASV